jgi:hypothetical protein
MTTTGEMTIEQIEALFAALAPEEKVRVISHGVALRLSDLQKRHFLAGGKVRHYEEKYHTVLEVLEAEGLPEDAGYEMHEDYVMWQHWNDVLRETAERIAVLEKIAEQGLYVGELVGAGQ